MELEGHPTHDIVDELQRRGALLYPGTDAGPDAEHLRLAAHRTTHEPGLWLFLPKEAYATGFDEEPPIP